MLWSSEWQGWHGREAFTRLARLGRFREGGTRAQKQERKESRPVHSRARTMRRPRARTTRPQGRMPRKGMTASRTQSRDTCISRICPRCPIGLPRKSFCPPRMGSGRGSRSASSGSLYEVRDLSMPTSGVLFCPGYCLGTLSGSLLEPLRSARS